MAGSVPQPGWVVVVVVVVGEAGAEGSAMPVVAWVVFSSGGTTAGPIGWVAR